MALEWILLGCAAAAEATLVLLLTLPATSHLRAGLTSMTRYLLKPFLAVVPFCFFLMLDIYWKHETRPSCRDSAGACTPTELMRHQKSIIKSQRNGLLIASALMFYWLLFAVTRLVGQMELLNQRIEKMKEE